jgi:hypothetical protein
VVMMSDWTVNHVQLLLMLFTRECDVAYQHCVYGFECVVFVPSRRVFPYLWVKWTPNSKAM